MSSCSVAVLADVHFHDTTADFGTGVMLEGRRRALRSWQDTATGARAVNESAASLERALEIIRARGIRHVVLLGDYTDDGQVETTARLAALLRDRSERHGLHFYAIPGNHDIYGPHGKHNSTRLSTAPDRSVLVTSDPEVASSEAGAVLAPGMFCAGQPQGLGPMSDFGLFRQPAYRHWESPFGPDDATDTRMYEARSPDGGVSHRLFDASYLVEPEDGLWLLMLDANVFRPRAGIADSRRKRAFHDPSTAGWNEVLREKSFLLAWIADVHRRAVAEEKRLLVFSHYPVADPFEDDGSERALFGDSEIAKRTPGPEVAAHLARLGLRQHFGGHIHANGETQVAGLTHISVPSTSAFPPGFVLVHAKGVETVSLADLPLPEDLLAFYRASGATPATDLGPFLWHQIQQRARKHHMPRLFPQGVSALAEGIGDDAAQALVADWYAIRQAGPLARPYLEPRRLAFLRGIAAEGDPAADPGTPRGFRRRFLSMLDRALRRMGD